LLADLYGFQQGAGYPEFQLARRLGKKNPRSIRIELRISHDELASMVGTTRPLVSLFMERFKHLGLIETSLEHHPIIKESKLTTYLKSIL
jgi:CRP/FNR family cyclic AMP-dependent transcriptional regulator